MLAIITDTIHPLILITSSSIATTRISFVQVGNGLIS